MKNGLIIDQIGTKRYYLNDKLHREDGPALEFLNGNKEWHLYGKTYREGGPSIERANGDKEWWMNNLLHREDGPAIEYGNRYKAYYINGIRHREDGPAVEDINGNKSYYLDNHPFGKQEYWEEIKKRKSLNFILKNYFKTRRTFSNISFPIVRRVFSQLIQKDFISIQPMELPSSIFFFEYTYDSNPSIDSSIQDNSCVINETENVNICS